VIRLMSVPFDGDDDAPAYVLEIGELFASEATIRPPGQDDSAWTVGWDGEVFLSVPDAADPGNIAELAEKLRDIEERAASMEEGSTMEMVEVASADSTPPGTIRRVRVAAECRGTWGFHESIADPEVPAPKGTQFSVSHVPSGMAVVQLRDEDSMRDLFMALSERAPHFWEHAPFGGRAPPGVAGADIVQAALAKIPQTAPAPA